MDFWPEFLAGSLGREFVAGGFGGTAGVISGYPLDTLRIRQQQHSSKGSALSILRHVVAREGPCALYRGMAAPLASVSFQNAIAFQSYTILSRALDGNVAANDPTSYKGVALGGTGAGAIQSLLISPVELVKIRRGLGVTVLRDAPSHGVYFLTYEYMREQLHPGCRKNGQESFRTMLLAGGLAGVTSWISCYPLDVIKTRIQAHSHSSPLKYSGIIDCFRRIVREEGYHVLWRGLGTTVARAFFVNGAIFTAYETALFDDEGIKSFSYWIYPIDQIYNFLNTVKLGSFL